MKICRRTGKLGYRSVGEARAAAAEINAKESVNRLYTVRRENSAYPCPWCPRWHLTSQRQSGPRGVNFDDPA